MPHVGETADAVLQHLHPIDEKNGFTSEIFLSEVEPRAPAPGAQPPDRRLQPARRTARPQRPRRYYVHADLYTTLARIRAR